MNKFHSAPSGRRPEVLGAYPYQSRQGGWCILGTPALETPVTKLDCRYYERVGGVDAWPYMGGSPLFGCLARS